MASSCICRVKINTYNGARKLFLHALTLKLRILRDLSKIFKDILGKFDDFGKTFEDVLEILEDFC